ncbi:MAG: hypothetical protein AAF547_00875 [Actinomycetota bacterium]
MAPRTPVALSLETIADAALAIGFRDLAITRVAEHLGVTHSAIYYYVPNRRGLIIAALDRAIAGIEAPDATDDWRVLLTTEAELLRELMQAHRGVRAAIETVGDPVPAFRARGHAMLGRLVELGFAPWDAFVALDLIYNMVLAHGSDLPTEEADRPPDQLEARFGADLGPMIGDALADPAMMFRRRIEVIIAGIAATAGLG